MKEIDTKDDKRKETLYDQLKAYGESDFYGFHMPGHKRNEQLFNSVLPYQLDITEIDGFDDLHHSTGVLAESQRRASELYMAEETHFLVNGSTVGIISAILGCTRKGDQILVARNCHKSVYHAIFLNELKPVYVYPKYHEELQLNGEIDPQDVKEILQKNTKIRAIVLVSPTYDGVVSDLPSIAKLAHLKRIPLIVDEAHGAHFGFHPYFPPNANTKGADIVIHSLHKTMPALTQSALIHLNGSVVNRRKIRDYIHMLQSSSPSYILMAGMDSCIHLMETKGQILFEQYVSELKRTREAFARFQYLKLLETSSYDRSKLVISVKDAHITSRELYDKLLKYYHLQMEMSAGSYVIAMTSIGDRPVGFNRLIKACREIEQYCENIQIKREKTESIDQVKVVNWELPQALIYYTSAKMKQIEEAFKYGEIWGNIDELQDDGNTKIRGEIKSLLWRDCIGSISTEYAYVYPPGIPLLVPGEMVTEQIIFYLEQYRDLGLTIEGFNMDNYIEVWING